MGQTDHCLCTYRTRLLGDTSPVLESETPWYDNPHQNGTPDPFENSMDAWQWLMQSTE
jgi:hypothetical protein